MKALDYLAKCVKPPKMHNTHNGHRNIIQAIDPSDPGQAADLDNVGVRDGGLRRQLKGVPRPLLLRVAVPALGDLDSDLDALFREESRENSM